MSMTVVVHKEAYADMVSRIRELEALARELVEALEIACDGMYVNTADIRMARVTLAKAKEVLDDEN